MTVEIIPETLLVTPILRVEPIKTFEIEITIVDSQSNSYKMMNLIRRKLGVRCSDQNVSTPFTEGGSIYETVILRYSRVSAGDIDGLLTIAKKTKQLSEIKVDGYAI